MKKIRTRYAPSPTGFLHIGGARTALFNYLFAKHYNGDFILRIEDTDVARNVTGGEESQLNNLQWLGIIPDESPINPNVKYGKYRQSEKLARYQQIIDVLIERKIAYKAYDNSEELAQQRKEQEQKGIFSFRYDKNWLKISEQEKQKREQNKEYSVRIHLPKDEIYSWNDIVRGKISVNTNDISDWVIQKSDGFPTYNFAVVIDDHDMEISHVLRGEEHITNTPKQIGVYKALGWKIPEFGHLTIITNMEGQKLSKRDFSVKQFIEDYKNSGYLPEAIFNFLALLGWTSEDAKEIFTKNDLIKAFDEKRLSKSPSKFDIKKMEWFSKQYMKNTDNNFIATKLITAKEKNWLNLFIDIYKQNSINFNDLQNSLLIYEDIKSENQFEFNEQENEVIKTFANFLKDSDFNVESIQNAINQTKQQTKLNGKNLFMPIRKAITNQEHGPELASSIYLFGQKIIFERLKKWK